MATLKLGSTTVLTETSGALTIGVSNPTVTLGSNATFPAGHILQVVDAYTDGGDTSYSTGNTTNPGEEISSILRCSFIPISTGSKIIVSYQTTNCHVNNKVASFAIGHEVTASNGTATAANLLSGLVTIADSTNANAFFRQGEIANYSYAPIYLEVIHSPSYTLGQKIWYTVIAYSSSGTIYLTNGGDVRTKIIEIKG